MAGKGNPNWIKGGQSPNPSGGRRTDAAETKIAALATTTRARADGYQNSTTGMGIAGKDKTVTGAGFCADIVDVWTAEQIWRGDPIGARLVEMRVDDATAEQPELCIGDYEAPDYYKPDPAPKVLPGKPLGKGKTDGLAHRLNSWERRVVQALGHQRRRADAEDTKSASEEITQHLGRNGINAMGAINETLKYREAYGGGAVLIGANDYTTDLRTPLDLKRVRSLDYLVPLESRELQPLYYYNDPFAPDGKFGRVAIYQLVPFTPGAPINAMLRPNVYQIHESRLLVFDGPRVSRRQLTGALSGWGDSIFTRVYRALRSYASAIQNVDVLLSSFAQAIYKIKGLASSLVQNPNALTDAMMAVELCRSMINAIIIDEGEEFKRESVSLAGYAEVIASLQQNATAASGLPATRLWGSSATGLNATGEGDDRFYFDGVGKVQTHQVAPAYMRLVEIEMAIRGMNPADTTHSVAFKSLWRPSEKEIAETRKTVADTDAVYYNAGVLSPEEIALSRFGGDGWSMETHIDLEARAQQMAVIPPPVDTYADDEEEDGNPDDDGLDEDGNPDGENVDGEDSDEYDELVSKYEDAADFDPESTYHEDRFNPNQKRGPDGKFFATGAAHKPAAPKGRQAPEGAKAGSKVTAKPKVAAAAKPKATKAKAATTAKPKAAKPPSATSLQKAAGVSSSSAVGQAIKKHVAEGNHEKAAALAADVKKQRETTKAAKAAEKEAAAKAKAERAAARAAKAAAKVAKPKATKAPVKKATKPEPKAAPAKKATHLQQDPEAAATAAYAKTYHAAQDAFKQAPKSNGSLAEAFGNGVTHAAGTTAVAALSKDSQKALREHFNGEIAKHGLYLRAKHENDIMHISKDVVEVGSASSDKLGYRGQFRMQTSRVTLANDVVTGLNYHAHYDPKTVGERVGRGGNDPGFQAYRTMIHESVHGHGPQQQDGSKHGTFHEEITTEMSARHISALVHGIEGHQIKEGGYETNITGAVQHVATVTGRSYKDSFNALAQASLASKRESNADRSGRTRTSNLAHSTLKILGHKSTDAPKLEAGWGAIAQTMAGD